ncbi:MAG: hypothetical protein KatS3mg060_1657 [Dehalococcoidia bacterium]|nr:MAG: hypothetical protein KatS3mg060_1657 [Dehalococcoidia bacterium]
MGTIEGVIVEDAATGPATARLAHLMNNRLTVITGALELVVASGELSRDLESVVAGALQATAELSQLVRDLASGSPLVNECSPRLYVDVTRGVN